jgi:non-ribosomal peptide synthase protein (TIGR01720 family)
VELESTNAAQFPPAERDAVLTAKMAELQASLDLLHGPLVRFHLFQQDPQEGDQLLITAHHLVIDGISWRIILEDLQTAYGRGERELPAQTTSFQDWARALSAYAEGSSVQQEFLFWLDQVPPKDESFPCDFPSGTHANTAHSIRNVAVSLAPEQTRALLHDVPAAYQTRINDILLTALAEVLRPWTGSNSVCIDLEGHGREEILDGTDLSRTVGWFTSIFPVTLRLDGPDPGDALKSIKEQLRRIPNNGIGYGILRYLCPDRTIAGRLREAPKPWLSFNYLGQFDQAFAGSSIYRTSPPQIQLSQDPDGRTDHILSVNAAIVRGQLQVVWSYSESIHHRATIDALARSYTDALERLIRHCQSPQTGGFTPSDFPEAGLNQEELDALLQEIGNE